MSYVLGLALNFEEQINLNPHLIDTTDNNAATMKSRDEQILESKFKVNTVDTENKNITDTSSEMYKLVGHTTDKKQYGKEQLKEQLKQDFNKTTRQKRSVTTNTCSNNLDPVCPSRYETRNLSHVENGIKRVVVCVNTQPTIENTLLECKEIYKCKSMKRRDCNAGSECYEDVRVPVGCIATKPVIIQTAM